MDDEAPSSSATTPRLRGRPAKKKLLLRDGALPMKRRKIVPADEYRLHQTPLQRLVNLHRKPHSQLVRSSDESLLGFDEELYLAGEDGGDGGDDDVDSQLDASSELDLLEADGHIDEEAQFTVPLKVRGSPKSSPRPSASPRASRPSSKLSIASPQATAASPKASPRSSMPSPRGLRASPKTATPSPNPSAASPKPKSVSSPKPSLDSPTLEPPSPLSIALKSPRATRSPKSPMPTAVDKLKSPTAGKDSPKPTIPLPAHQSPVAPLPLDDPEPQAMDTTDSPTVTATEGATEPVTPPTTNPTPVATPKPAATKAAKPSKAAAAAAKASSQQASPTKPLSSQDEFYRKPFEFGWKRELVWRANMETSKEKADVYFITPSGKKVRTRNEILPLLGDPALSIDHFCFAREPTGAGPEHETVRSAKPTIRTIMAAVPPPTPPPLVTMGKRVSKPKGPKGASPPPEGWTPTRALKVNNAALLRPVTSDRFTDPMAPVTPTPPKREAIGAGAGGGVEISKKKTKKTPKPSLENATNSATHTDSTPGTPIATVSKLKRSRTPSSTSTPGERPAKVPAPDAPTLNNNNKSGSATHEPCSNKCPKGGGLMPQLQCVKCLCLYHHECVGLMRHDSEYRTLEAPGKDYVCEACQPPAKATTTASGGTKTTKGDERATKSGGSKKSSTSGGADGGGSSTRNKSPVYVRPPKKGFTAEELNNITPKERQESGNGFTQELAVVKGRRYVVLKKPKKVEDPHAAENNLKKLRDENRSRLAAHSLDGHGQQSGESKQWLAGRDRLFGDSATIFNVLVNVFKYLKVHERPRAARVCRMWNAASKDASLWTTILLKNSKVNSWAGFAPILRGRQTRHLDLNKMLLTGGRVDDMWSDFSKHIGKATTLETIELCRCPASVVEGLFKTLRNLRVLNAVAIGDNTLNFDNIEDMPKLRELRLRSTDHNIRSVSLRPLAVLDHLKHVSLTGFKELAIDDLYALGELSALRSLELGDCGHFDETFAEKVLPNLRHLERLRLENAQDTTCDTLAILESCSELPKLSQLELVNFDIKPGFDDKLQQCSNIDKLLIIPTYISQSATTNHIVLSAVQRAAGALKVFTWGVTVELLRVTALYVGQCDESIHRENYMFDECIPVLKPVPRLYPDEEVAADGATENDAAADGEKDGAAGEQNSDVPQIEILPLEKVETILEQSLPQTKFNIVKMAYAMTWKQHLVE